MHSTIRMASRATSSSSSSSPSSSRPTSAAASTSTPASGSGLRRHVSTSSLQDPRNAASPRRLQNRRAGAPARLSTQRASPSSASSSSKSSRAISNLNAAAASSSSSSSSSSSEPSLPPKSSPSSPTHPTRFPSRKHPATPTPPPPEPRPRVLPNELFLQILGHLDIPDLARVRLASRHLRSLAGAPLSVLVADRARALERQRRAVDGRYRDIERQKRPHLRHYRQFLRGISTSEVTEATWYSSPPQELQTVCECLFILKGKPGCEDDVAGGGGSARGRARGSIGGVGGVGGGGGDSAANGVTGVSSGGGGSNGGGAMSWPNLKRTMTRYDFKTWLTNLRVEVDYIPMKNIREAERVIMMDNSITYERLRAVSTAGYKLLIIVAACLQYCNIAEELREKGKELSALLMKEEKTKKYLECLV